MKKEFCPACLCRKLGYKSNLEKYGIYHSCELLKQNNMKNYELRLKQALQEKMDSYIDEMCETPEWEKTGIFISPETSAHMTDAAMAVFLALSHGIENSIDEGYLTTK